MQACRAAFFLISDWKTCQDPLLERAQNIVNTDVFDRFHFFHFFMNFESSRLTFGSFLEPWGDSWMILGGPGNTLEFRLKN